MSHICERQSDDLFFYNQQDVSDIAHLVTGSLMTAFPMSNSKWVTLNISGKAVTWIFSYDQQSVSDIAHFVIGSLLTSSPITIACEQHCTFCSRKSHLNIFFYDQQHVSKIACFEEGNFLWPTASELNCTLCERQSHCILSYDQQQVSDIVHFVKSSPITFIHMIAGCEWYWTFGERQPSESWHLFL